MDINLGITVIALLVAIVLGVITNLISNILAPCVERRKKLVWSLFAGCVAVAVLLVILPSMLPKATFPKGSASAIATAKAGESLIVIADFDDQSEGTQKGIQPAQYIYDQLKEQAKKDNLNIRIERLHEVMDDKTAKSVGETYGATLLLWGWYNRLSVKPNIERLRTTTFTPLASTERLSISDPNKVELVITNDLPNQVSYLTLLTLGLEQYGTGDLAEALHYFDTIVTTVALDQITMSTRSEVYYWRGIAHMNQGFAYRNKGNLEQAIAEYDEASENYAEVNRLKPNNAAVFYDLGTASLEKGDLKRAIGDHDQATQAYNQAIEDLNKAILYKNTYMEAYTNRGSAYSAIGDYDQAIQDFTQAISLTSDTAINYYDLGNAYTAKGNSKRGTVDYYQGIEDYDQAIKSYDQAIKYQKNMVEAFLNRGNAYANRAAYYNTIEDYDQAIENFTQAINLRPNFELAYYNRAKAYKVKNDQPKAIADLRKLLELNKDPTPRAVVIKELEEMGVLP